LAFCGELELEGFLAACTEVVGATSAGAGGGGGALDPLKIVLNL
jgi:hypothetical protein